MHGVEKFSFENEGPPAWDYVELTSIELRKPRRGPGVQLSLEFWNGIANAVISAASSDLTAMATELGS